MYNNIDFISCGGCKLLYDRSQVHDLIAKDLKQSNSKILIVMNGCFRGCEEIDKKYDKIINVEKHLDLIDKKNNDPYLLVERIFDSINDKK